MNEKQFRVQEHCLRSSYGIEAENWLVTNDNHCIVLTNKSEAHMVANMLNDVVDLLNELNDTNQELYDFRLVLNALLFNEWAENGKYEVYKSKRHSDGELCFEGEWFVVVAILPTGQVTNHYHIKYWDYFKIPAYDTVKDEFDGHTSTDVLIRYGLMLK